MMDNPKVSIIVPVYNGQEYIINTIQMILSSSLKEIEVVLVDDGSTDKSFSICTGLAEEDKRIRVFKQKNTGVFGARNYGLKEATGKYICFCDQDDMIEPDTYEKMYMAAEKNNSEVVLTGTGKLIGNQKAVFEQFEDKVLREREIVKQCVLPIVFNGTNCYENDVKIRMENDIWKCMIRRSFITDNGLFFRRYVNYEDDFLFLLDVLARAKCVTTISDVLYYWRVNLKSETYNTAYVENLYEKGIKLQDELIHIAHIADIKQEYMEKFIMCQNCNRYIEIVRNAARNSQMTLKEKAEYIKIIQNEPQFEQSLQIRKEFRPNLVYRKIILFLFEKHQFLAAYFFFVVHFKIKKIGLKFNVWTQIENYLYKKK